MQVYICGAKHILYSVKSVAFLSSNR